MPVGDLGLPQGYKANKDSIRKALKDEEDWRKKDLENRFDLNMVRRNRAPE